METAMDGATYAVMRPVCAASTSFLPGRQAADLPLVSLRQSALGSRRMVNSMRSPGSSRHDSISVM
jgi:hypothetical protein